LKKSGFFFRKKSQIMNRFIRIVINISIALTCIAVILLQTIHPAATVPNLAIGSPSGVNLAQPFKDLGVEGSIVIYDSKQDRLYQHNAPRNATAVLPASTFKILNSLIALETNTISNELAILTWDGIPKQLPEWNRDLNMREAFKLSAVWFYQVLARKVGFDRMQKYVTQANYGNQKIGTKEQIDSFWLNGELRISPLQQIQFLRRLYTNELPFSDRSISIVKDITIVEQTPDYIIRAKSGLVGFGDPNAKQIGWYVGYLEKGKNAYFFVTNIDVRNPKDLANRKELTRRCLKILSLL
jgi:beta-lactamase class D